MKAVAISLEYFRLWPNPFYDKDMSIPISIFYIFQFTLYNHLPLGVLLYLHHKNFRQLRMNQDSKPADKSELKSSHQSRQSNEINNIDNEIICVDELQSSSDESVEFISQARNSELKKNTLQSSKLSSY